MWICDLKKSKLHEDDILDQQKDRYAAQINPIIRQYFLSDLNIVFQK